MAIVDTARGEFICNYEVLTYCFARRDEQTAPNCVKAAFRKTSLITVTDIHRDHCLVKEQSSAKVQCHIQSDVNFDSANGFGLTNNVFSLELKLINWLLSNLAGASFVWTVNFHCPTEVMFTGCSCSCSGHS